MESIQISAVLIMLTHLLSHTSAFSFTGYIIDNYCWDFPNHRGIDGAQLGTAPQTHIIHCLPACAHGGFAVLEQLPTPANDGSTYGIKYQLDAKGNALLVQLANAEMTRAGDRRGLEPVTVSGTLVGNVIQASSLCFTPQHRNSAGTTFCHPPLPPVPIVAQTNSPTEAPVIVPTRFPTNIPTRFPTNVLTNNPTETHKPTQSPTSLPTENPTDQPTGIPTLSPTDVPSTQPTAAPKKVPTLSPSGGPTGVPHPSPTVRPQLSTSVPTHDPTDNLQIPINHRTDHPIQATGLPIRMPTVSPVVTHAPSYVPSNAPSNFPSAVPSAYPTGYPTRGPIFQPTLQPSETPNHTPTVEPSTTPSMAPTRSPLTSTPTPLPTSAETHFPTVGGTPTAATFATLIIVVPIATLAVLLVGVAISVRLWRRKEKESPTGYAMNRDSMESQKPTAQGLASNFSGVEIPPVVQKTRVFSATSPVLMVEGKDPISVVVPPVPILSDPVPTRQEAVISAVLETNVQHPPIKTANIVCKP